ncbi:death-associated protein-like 1 homolog [Lepisosteus oculatus]|nr:PREDICTED: death-associated protein-like 1 [Lepisosteus oculatus]
MVKLSKAGIKPNSALKAGHPPAVKAGGKRVAKKNMEENAPPEKEVKRPAADKSRSVTILPKMQSISILLSGTLEKLSHDFPATPASVRHNKPRPAVEKLYTPKMYFIQQPRKC